MTKTHYTLNGMTCSSCEAKVRDKIYEISDVKEVLADRHKNLLAFHSVQPIPQDRIQQKIQELGPKYSIAAPEGTEMQPSGSRSWWKTYKPVVLILLYILLVAGLIEITMGDFIMSRCMRHYMAGFFLVFSFFKILDIDGFKMSYQTYDVISKQWPVWASLYTFVELGLGIAFVLNIFPAVIYGLTLVLMSIGLYGVILSVRQKEKIQCACLGTVFDLPMSTVTIIENGLMIAMSVFMLINLL